MSLRAALTPALVLIASASASAGALGCAHTTPRAGAPLGEVRLTSAELAPRPYVPSSIALYVERQTPRSCGTGLLPYVKFEFGSSDVGEPDDFELRRIASCLTARSLDGEEILLVGHADPIGSARSNLELGLERANAVRARLVAHGIAPERIAVRSEGASTLPRDEWDEARRVDMFLVPRTASPSLNAGSAPAW